MSRSVLVSIVLACLLLAGCTGSGAPEAAKDALPAAREGSGRLEGSVVNDGFIGVPGASVKILGLTDSRRTDVEGRFVFAEVPPGSYKVRVEATGWIPAEVTTKVETGATTQLTIFVEPQILDEPYSTMQQVRGKLNCIAVRVVSTTTEGMACDVYRKDLGFPADWAGTVTEVTWSKGLTSTPYSRVSLLSKNATDSPTYGRQIAESPSKLVLRPGQTHSQYQADTPTPAKLNRGPLFVEIIKSPVQVATVEVRAGLTVQQDFELYHTTFYVETPSTIDDYSALPK
jgi:hypothetical protein